MGHRLSGWKTARAQRHRAPYLSLCEVGGVARAPPSTAEQNRAVGEEREPGLRGEGVQGQRGPGCSDGRRMEEVGGFYFMCLWAGRELSGVGTAKGKFFCGLNLLDIPLL